MIPSRTLLLCGGALLVAATPPARADAPSDTLLKQVKAATAATRTLTADLELTRQADDSAGHKTNLKLKGAVKLKRPNLARIYINLGTGHSQTIASNGKTLYMTFGNQYIKNTPGAAGDNIQPMWAYQVNMFFQPGIKSLGNDGTTKYLGRQNVDGKPYEVIEVTPKQSATAHEGETMKLYISPEKLVTRMEITGASNGQKVYLTAALTNVKCNVALDDIAFAYSPPKTLSAYKPPDYTATLVPVGKPAPGFDLLRPEGGRISLENTLTEKKAVLVNFWFYG